jgi:DNA-directed RNA polymerase beta subunit
MIEKLKQLIDPHIESFDYFLEEGIKEAVNNLETVSIKIPLNNNKNLLLRWGISSIEIGYPCISSTLRDEVLPHNCREGSFTYASPFFAELWYYICEEEIEEKNDKKKNSYNY